MNILIVLALILIIVWLVAHVALAMTSVFLHLIWILALILLAVGIFQQIKK